MFSNFTHMIRVPSNSAKKQNKLEITQLPDLLKLDPLLERLKEYNKMTGRS